MKRLSRSPLFAVVFIMLAAAAAFTLGSKNASFEAMAAPDDKYKALDTFSQALNLIENAYVEPVDQKNIIYGAIKGMLQELDPHSTFYTPDQYKSFQVDTKGSFGGLGITISLRDDAMTIIAPIEDTPADKAGLKAGDVIIMIEGVPTSGMTLEDAVSKMRGEPGTKVNITVVRKGENKPLDFTLERAVIKIKSVKYGMADNSTGYLRLTQFQEGSSKEMTKALAELDKSGAKGLVLDLRNNGGGLLTESINIASLFLPPDKSVVYTKDRSGAESHYKTKRISYRDNARPIVVIVNEGSASASEILAGALQDYGRAVILGSTTFGKASVQSIIDMKDGSAIKLTTARYYTPKGRSIQGVGIVPDVQIGAGKIEFSENPYIIKERDLSNHLIGENEKTDSASSDNATGAASGVMPPSDDVQYRSAIQVLKGMIAYGHNAAA